MMASNILLLTMSGIVLAVDVALYTQKNKTVPRWERMLAWGIIIMLILLMDAT